MSHYQITLGINKTDVEIIRKHLNKYLEEGGEIAIGVDKIQEDSVVLLQTIRNLFIELLATLRDDNFEGIH